MILFAYHLKYIMKNNLQYYLPSFIVALIVVAFFFTPFVSDIKGDNYIGGQDGAGCTEEGECWEYTNFTETGFIFGDHPGMTVDVVGYLFNTVVVSVPIYLLIWKSGIAENGEGNAKS